METNEEVIYGVVPEIVYERMTDVIKDIVSDVKRLKEARKIRDSLGYLFKAAPSSDDVCFFAVDSSYADPSIMIAGGYIGIVQVASLVVGTRCDEYHDVRVYIEYHPTRDITAVKARLYEREHLIWGLKRKREEKLFFDVAIVDGEILYRGEINIEYASGDEGRIIEQTVENTKRALGLAGEMDTPIVGVLKRSYSRDISIVHGYPDLVINDRLLMTMILEPGEFYVLGTYGDLYKKYKEILESMKHIGSMSDNQSVEIKHRYRWIERIATQGFSEYRDDVYVVYYKPYTPPHSLAVKLEVYPTKSWDISKIVTALALIAGESGFPLALDLADSLSTVSSDMKRLIYSLIKSHIAQEDPELAELVTKLMNPQKPL